MYQYSVATLEETKHRMDEAVDERTADIHQQIEAFVRERQDAV